MFKTTTKAKELVTLRQREMKNGGRSLYLDYCVNGIRTREFLKMYLVHERTKVDRLQNQETLKQANALKSKRTIELQQGQVGIRRKGKDMLLLDFIKAQQEEYRKRGKPFYVETLGKIRRWMEEYGKKASLQTLDKKYVLDFCDFLRGRGLSQGTIYLYFSNLNTILNNAYRADLIQENPISRIDHSLRPRSPESERDYLTFDEVKKLIKARCGHEVVKRAFLFSCFTGLRLGDIEALTWDRIRDSGKGLQVEAMQIKTQKAVYIPLSANAIAQLPDGEREGRVFGLPSRYTVNYHLHRWVKDAGITKHISFHCARHTYATLLLTYGANIYTVSSLLGHTNVITTQIYAKIVDENKRKTVDLIPDIGER